MQIFKSLVLHFRYWLWKYRLGCFCVEIPKQGETHKMACLLPKICILRFPWLTMLITEPKSEKMSKYIFNNLNFRMAKVFLSAYLKTSQHSSKRSQRQRASHSQFKSLPRETRVSSPILDFSKDYTDFSSQSVDGRNLLNN